MKTSPKILIAVSALAVLLFSYSVFAAGEGGGGTPPPSPSPAPSPSPSPSPAPSPTSSGTGCSADTWSCSEWNACRENGRQARLCQVLDDCPSVQSPKPLEDRVCTGLQCGHLETLEERVKCRLGLTDVQLAEEFKILYFPEYCRAEESQEEKQECIALYTSFQPCWNLPRGAGREICAKKLLKITNPKSMRAFCNKKKKGPRAVCNRLLDGKVKNLTLFQMYEYAWWAEDLMKKGTLTLDATADFDVYVERKKQELEHAPNQAAWNHLLKEIREKFEGLGK